MNVFIICQKNCNAYYNVPMLHGEEKIRVHLW